MKNLGSRWIGQALFCVILFFFCLASPALATVRNVKTTCGAAGDGVADDTAAINACISQLVSGDTLSFPAGTYRVTSGLIIAVNNTTVDGSSNTATIKCNGGRYCITVGGGGLTASTPLTANAAVGATTFQADFAAIGLVSGDYAELEEGGIDVARLNFDPLGCSVATPCRSEVVHVSNVSGNTAAVDTAVQTVPGLHWPFNFQTPASIGCSSPFTSCPNANGAHVYKVASLKSGIAVQNITVDGTGSSGEGAFLVKSTANTKFSDVTIKNFPIEAIQGYFNYNDSYINVTVTAVGNPAVNFKNHGHTQISAMSISNLLSYSFAFFIGGGADDTVSGVTADGAGTSVGRPFNTGAESYSTFNNGIVRNGATGENGISVQYYSQHLTYNGFTITNNSNSGGVIGFGNENTYNTFNNMTITGGRGYAIADNGSGISCACTDSNWTVNGGTFGNSLTGDNLITLPQGSGYYIHDATFTGPAGYGINLTGSTNSCVNNNVFTNGLAGAIATTSNTVVGTGNTLNGFSSNLTDGTCGTDGQSQPNPPTGLTAVVR